jgi:hypothetical protein
MAHQVIYHLYCPIKAFYRNLTSSWGGASKKTSTENPPGYCYIYSLVDPCREVHACMQRATRAAVLANTINIWIRDRIKTPFTNVWISIDRQLRHAPRSLSPLQKSKRKEKKIEMCTPGQRHSLLGRHGVFSHCPFTHVAVGPVLGTRKATSVRPSVAGARAHVKSTRQKGSLGRRRHDASRRDDSQSKGPPRPVEKAGAGGHGRTAVGLPPNKYVPHAPHARPEMLYRTLSRSQKQRKKNCYSDRLCRELRNGSRT